MWSAWANRENRGQMNVFSEGTKCSSDPSFLQGGEGTRERPSYSLARHGGEGIGQRRPYSLAPLGERAGERGYQSSSDWVSEFTFCLPESSDLEAPADLL